MLNRRLILNEFDVCDLLFGRRRHQEEKCQHEETCHESYVKEIASAGGFGHGHNIFRVYASALKQGGMVVSVANSESYK